MWEGWGSILFRQVELSQLSVTVISQCSAVTSQTFRPIVRPLLSALTELDLIVAVTPGYLNLFDLDPFWRFHQQLALSPPALAASVIFSALAPRPKRTWSPKYPGQSICKIAYTTIYLFIYGKLLQFSCFHNFFNYSE